MVGSSPRALQIFSRMEVATENINSRVMSSSNSNYDSNYQGEIAIDSFRPVIIMQREVKKSSLTSLFEHDFPDYASPKNEMKRKQQYQFIDMSSEIDSMHKERGDNVHNNVLETGVGSGLGLRRNKSSALLFENNEEEVNIIHKNNDGFKSSLRRNKSSALLFGNNEELSTVPPGESTKTNYQDIRTNYQDPLNVHDPDVTETNCIEKSALSSNSMLASALPLKRRSVEDLSKSEQPLVSALRPPPLPWSSTEVYTYNDLLFIHACL
jgi:hypothetical protein